MPGRDHFSRLHDDLVVDILVLLPLKQVARAQLVCRRWRALTTHYRFARTVYSRPRSRATAGFFFNYRTQAIVDYFPLDSDGEAGDRLAPGLSFIPGTLPANPGRQSMQIYGSCGGLLLLVCWRPHGEAIHCVCNPLTKKAVPIRSPAACLSSWSLAFDPSKSPHYKVVTLGDMYDIHVYSSETRSWRMAIHHSNHSAGLFRGLCPTRGVFWSGSIVWVVSHSLVRFVIEDEQVMKMPMPPRKRDWICAYIGESDGHLQMVGYTKKEKLTACFDILEMQENQSEWSVMYRVNLCRVKELYPNIEWPTWIIDYLALSPIYVIRGSGKAGQHMLVFSVPDKIMSYNMDDQEILMVKEIAQICRLEHFWHSFHAYNPSLFAV